jgi:hypothetical protein
VFMDTGYGWWRGVSMDTDTLYNMNQNWVRDQIRMEPVVESEWCESSAVMKEDFGWRFIVSYCNLLWLRVIVWEGVNKSDHPIQNPSY